MQSRVYRLNCDQMPLTQESLCGRSVVDVPCLRVWRSGGSVDACTKIDVVCPPSRRIKTSLPLGILQSSRAFHFRDNSDISSLLCLDIGRKLGVFDDILAAR